MYGNIYKHFGYGVRFTRRCYLTPFSSSFDKI